MLNRSETALSLMKMALALLDRDAEVLAACHLQHAIEIAEHPGESGRPGRALSVTRPSERSQH